MSAALRGEARAAAELARRITRLERGEEEELRQLEALALQPRRARRVVVTGPPGVGKSSLLRELAARLVRAGARVAIVACDPASELSGGAFLGDRCRLGALCEEPRLFFRSLAQRGQGAAALRGAGAAVELLARGDREWVFLETVGTGQMESDAFELGDVTLLVHAPGLGDELQMLKAGALERADVHVVTRCEDPGAAEHARRLAEALRHPAKAGAGKGPAIVLASGSTGEGVSSLIEELERRAPLRRSS